MRQDLHVDPGCIHLADADVEEIIKPFPDRRGRIGGGMAEMLGQVAVHEVFFDRDDLVCPGRVGHLVVNLEAMSVICGI